MQIDLVKTPNGYIVGCTPDDEAAIKKWAIGEVKRGQFTNPRNYEFHKKFFAMLNIGFDAWEPPELEYKGLPAQKSFDRFRKDVTIAAGFYDVNVNLKGEVRAEAKSISFAKMEQHEFEEVYSKVADVLLQKVLLTYTRADLDRVVMDIMRFVA